MKIEECYYLGYTSKVHGKNGELIFKIDVDAPDEYKALESVFIQMNKKDSALVPFFIEQVIVQHNGQLRVKIEDVNDPVEAKLLVGKELYLPLSVLPELTGTQFYYHEVIGFQVIDANKGPVGILKNVLDYPQNALFEIENGENEILVPITDEVVKEVKREAKEMIINAPEGLIDIYMD